MKDIYQKIWDADQKGNGVTPLTNLEYANEQLGYVKVNSALKENDKELRVLSDLRIPEAKFRTYKLALKLFDNYTLSESDPEVDTQEERTEVHEFVEAIIDTAPMQIAREYIANETGSSLSRQRWYNTIMEMWFRKYAQNGDPDLSGFEHVIIGEQDGSKAKGYHFWYKYYLDDGFAREQDGIYDGSFPELRDDRIDYHGSKMGKDQDLYPECVTISYRWFAPDYDRHGLRPLFKPIGGFFVGCSIEGLLALGTVRGHLGINAPRKAVINGAEYEMKLFHSNNRKHIRTFYPKFIRAIDLPDYEKGDGDNNEDCTGGGAPDVAQTYIIRIIAALVNPVGDDVGLETVTLINLGKESVKLNNWAIVDKNDKKSSFSIQALEPGDTYRIGLDGKDAQLSNKGGIIKLLDDKHELIHLVSYSREQIREQGISIIF